MMLHEIEASLKGRKLEEYNLSRLIECKVYAQIVITKLERSAREIKDYVIAETPFGDIASSELKNLKNELASRIDAEMQVYEDFYQRLNKEITKRLEATDK